MMICSSMFLTFKKEKKTMFTSEIEVLSTMLLDQDKKLFQLLQTRADYTQIKECIDAGANINKNHESTNLFHYVLQHYTDVNVIWLFMEKVNIHSVDNQGNTSLHIALEHNHIPSIIQLFIDHIVNMNIKNRYGNTALQYAIIYDHPVSLIEYMISKGADIQTRNQWNITPLHQAINEKRMNVIELLIEKNADVNVQCDVKNTCLHLALKNRLPISIIQLLIDHGADVNMKNKHGSSCIFFVLEKYTRKERDDLLMLLVQHGAHITYHEYIRLPIVVQQELILHNEHVVENTWVASVKKYDYPVTCDALWIKEIQACIDHHVEWKKDIYISLNVHDTVESLRQEFICSSFDHVKFKENFLTPISALCDYIISYTLNSVILSVMPK